MLVRPTGRIVNSGVDGTRTRGQNADESLVNKLDRDRKGKVESSRLETVRDHSRPVETVHGAEPAPTEAELERGILDAIKLGALDLARALSERLAKRHPSLLASAFDQVTEATGRRGRG
jgi:citrate lyase beta subunit